MNAITQQTGKYKEQAVLNRKQIIPAPWGNQRTRKRNPDKFAEIRADINQRGIDTPLAVRPSPTQENVYELLAGYGRFEIAELDNIETLPVVIHHGIDDSEAKLIMAAENMLRENLHVLDAANAAKDTLAELNGDMEALATFTGWQPNRIKLYFQLLRCTEKVQNLVDNKQDNGFVVTLGHANELSGIPSEMQDKIIDTVISQEMTIKELRSLIKSNLERPLTEAIFSTTDCDSCQFNRIHQVDMFAIDSKQGSICTNVRCFKDKEREHLDNRLAELKADNGNVIFQSEVSDLHVTVTKMSVGEDKFNNKCLSCSKYTQVLVDQGAEIDTIKESQCLNIECAKQKDVQVKTATTHDVNEQVSSEVVPKKKTKKTANQSKDDSSETAPEAKITRGVTLDALNHLQSEFAPLLCAHETYGFALMLFALRKLNKPHAQMKAIPELMKLSQEELSTLVHQEIATITTELNGENEFNGQELAILAGSTLDNAKETAIANWEPTKEILESMQKPLIQQVLEQSGFAKAFTDKHQDKGYAKLLGMKKTDQITAILAFNFSWEHYCPDFVISEIK